MLHLLLGVSLMKAQALGAIPITSRHYNSTLPELTGRFDLGPLMPSSSPRRNARIENDKQWQREWADAVVTAATSSSSDLSKHRKAMMQWAQGTLLWKHVAQKWHMSFEAATAVPPKKQPDNMFKFP